MHKMAIYKNSSFFATGAGQKTAATSSFFATVRGFSVAENEPVASFLYSRK